MNFGDQVCDLSHNSREFRCEFLATKFAISRIFRREFRDSSSMRFVAYHVVNFTTQVYDFVAYLVVNFAMQICDYAIMRFVAYFVVNFFLLAGAAVDR